MTPVIDPDADTVVDPTPKECVPIPSALPPPVDPRDRELDDTFAQRYVVRSVLGSGGMGDVRLCRDQRIGRDVALKTMQRQLATDASSVDRFLREARVQGQLEHPAIVPVHEIGVDPDEGRLAVLRSRYPFARFVASRAEALEDTVGRVDHAIVLRSYNHLEDPSRALDRVLALLKPGGTLTIVDNVAFGLVRNRAHAERAEREKRLTCLERCLNAMSPDVRNVLTDYYQGEKDLKIRGRKAIAERLGIPLNALRIRACRHRAKLEECVRACLRAVRSSAAGARCGRRRCCGAAGCRCGPNRRPGSSGPHSKREPSLWV